MVEIQKSLKENLLMNVCSFGVAPVVALIDGRAGEVNPKTVPSMKCPIDMAKTDKICSFLSRLKQMQEYM